MVSLLKTQPRISGARSEESCAQSRRVVVVPIVVKPVVVPVPPVAVPVEVTDIEVAVSVAVSYRIPSVPPPLECSKG